MYYTAVASPRVCCATILIHKLTAASGSELARARLRFNMLVLLLLLLLLLLVCATVCGSAALCGSASGSVLAMRAAVCGSALGRVCMAVRAAVCGCAALCGSAQQFAAVRATLCGSV